MPRAKQCRLRDHEWELLRGGRHEQCKKCKTLFPCKHDCEHLDCIAARAEMADGSPMPAWVG